MYRRLASARPVGNAARPLLRFPLSFGTSQRQADYKLNNEHLDPDLPDDEHPHPPKNRAGPLNTSINIVNRRPGLTC
jgi:hypothetical protein